MLSIKDKSRSGSKDKVLSIKEAVAIIKDGDNLSLSGFAHSLAPLALVREIVRQKKKNLESTSMEECWADDIV